MKGVAAGDFEIVLVRNSAGVVTALEDRCSHAEVRLSEGFVEGNEVECAAHGARFDAATGKALCMPAVAPVPTFQVKIQGDDVIVVVPEE